MFRRVIRLNERLDLLVIQEQERSESAEAEVRRLKAQHVAEKRVLEKDRSELRRERLGVRGVLAGKAVQRRSPRLI